MKIKVYMDCPSCEGTGMRMLDSCHRDLCNNCGGSGEVSQYAEIDPMCIKVETTDEG